MNIITKSARKETRRISGGERHLSVLKTQGNRKARHQMNHMTRMVAIGGFDADDTNFEPDFTIDGRDVS